MGKNNPYKRGKTWTIVYYIYSYVGGKKKRKQHQKGGYKTREEAAADLKKIRAQVELGLIKDYSSQPLEVYLRSWFEKHKVENDLASCTKNGYKVNIEHHIIPYIGNIKLKDLSTEDIRHLHQVLLDKELKPKTVVYVHNVLKAALGAAEEDDLVRLNVCKKVKPPRIEEYIPQLLSEEQLNKLVGNIKGDPFGPEIAMASMLGLRRGEILGIKTKDINFVKHTLTLSRQITIIKDNTSTEKTEEYYGETKLKSRKSNRTIDISPEIEELVKNQIKQNQLNKEKYGEMHSDNEYVFCDMFGSFKDPGQLDKAFKAALKKSNLPNNVRLHDLRHSFATVCADRHMVIKALSEILGHSSTAVTDKYYLHTINGKKELPNILREAFGSKDSDDESKESK